MSTSVIIVGSGDSEHGHYSILPGGHLAPGGGNYAIPVDDADEMTFTITPDEGYIIGDVLVSGINPYVNVGIGPVDSYTFTGLQSPTAPDTHWIFAYAVALPPPVTTKCPFPWWWIVAAAAGGFVVGKSGRKK